MKPTNLHGPPSAFTPVLVELEVYVFHGGKTFQLPLSEAKLALHRSTREGKKILASQLIHSSIAARRTSLPTLAEEAPAPERG